MIISNRGFIMPLAIVSLVAVLVALFVWFSINKPVMENINSKINNCGDGVCHAYCLNEVNSAPCENPKNCPQDCRLFCSWELEKWSDYRLETTENEELLNSKEVCIPAWIQPDKKIVTRPSLKSVIAEYSCLNNDDCMPGHLCAEVVFSTNPANEIKQGSICIVNPQ